MATGRRHDAGGDEGAGVAVDLRRQLGEGQPHVALDQRLERGVADRSVLDQTRHGAPEQVGSRVLLSAGMPPMPLDVCWTVLRGVGCAHGCWLLTETTSPLI